MGDADSQVLVAAREIEAWVDEALDQVDDGLDHMFTFMDEINDRMQLFISEVQKCERFRLCFAALNFFVVPVVLALGLCYGYSDAIGNQGEGLEQAWFEMIVMLLMFFSGVVGFPLYLYSVWELYKDSITTKRRSYALRSRTVNNLARRSYSDDDSNISNDSFCSLPFDPSVENLNDFARTLSAHLIEGVRTELDRRGQDSTRNEEAFESNRQSRKGMEGRRRMASPPEIFAALNSIESQDQEELEEDFSELPTDNEDSFALRRAQSEHAQMNESVSEHRPIQVIIVHSNTELPIEVKNGSNEEREILIQLSEKTCEERAQENSNNCTSLSSVPDYPEAKTDDKIVNDYDVDETDVNH